MSQGRRECLESESSRGRCPLHGSLSPALHPVFSVTDSLGRSLLFRVSVPIKLCQPTVGSNCRRTATGTWLSALKGEPPSLPSGKYLRWVSQTGWGHPKPAAVPTCLMKPWPEQHLVPFYWRTACLFCILLLSWSFY